MSKEDWKTVGTACVKDEKNSRVKTIDWKAETTYKHHSSTVSVHVSYRYTINLSKKK